MADESTAARRYTVAEIDRMRVLLWSIRSAHMVPGRTYLSSNSHRDDANEVERELRTLMIGGVGVDELETKLSAIKAATLIEAQKLGYEVFRT